MFWRVAGYSVASPIDAILDREQYTLEELLVEDDLIQECRSLNGRLIHFLGDKENVEAMLRYMLKPPGSNSDDSEEERRFAWQSCEVFCCEADPIFSVLLENKDTMMLFLDILDSQQPLDPTMTGYFGRVLTHLLLRKPIQLTQFLMENKGYVMKLISHLEDTSITEVLVKLMAADEQTNALLPMTYVQWIAGTQALTTIVTRLDNSEMERVQFNAAQVLITIIRSQPSLMARNLAEKTQLDHLLKFAVGENGRVSTPVLSVIISALDPNTFNAIRPMQSPASPEPRSEDALFQPLFQKVASLLPVFAKKLVEWDDSTVQRTPYGALTPPLGQARLKIIEMISILMEAASESLMDAIVDSGALKSCMELFVSYPFHNVLHNKVTSIFVSALASEYQPLLEEMFSGGLDLATWLVNIPQTVQALKTTQYHPSGNHVCENGHPVEVDEGKGLRAGYLGHTITLSNQILLAAESNSFIAELLNKNQSWKQYVSSVVHPTNRKENLDAWECGRPTDGLSRDSDGDLLRGDSDLPSSSNGVFRNRFLPDEDDEEDEDDDEEEEDEEENVSLMWRPMDSLTTENGEVTATAAMLARTVLLETPSRTPNDVNAPDFSTSSSSSSSSSSSEDGVSHSSSDDEETERHGKTLDVVVTPESLAQKLSLDDSPRMGKEGEEREASTSSAQSEDHQSGLSADCFNAFHFWKLEIPDAELPDPSVE